MNKRKIEVFTSGCPNCEPVVGVVKSLADDSCEIIVYNLSEPCDTKVCLEKVKEYKITSLPAVAVNGQLHLKEVSREQLSARIGQS